MKCHIIQTILLYMICIIHSAITDNDDSENKDDENHEVLPEPLSLAMPSPERSGLDEKQFNMAASYLKQQFSIPHHLVPSFDDVSGSAELSKTAAAQPADNHRVENHPNHQSDDRSRWLKAPDKTRTRLTSDNFYDYYDYVEVVPSEESANNYMNQWTQSSSFFPKVHLPSKPRGNQLPKRRNSLNYKKIKDKRKHRPSAKSQIKEMPSSFSTGSWIQPPHSPDRDSHIPEYEVFNEINKVKYNENVKYKLPPLSPSRPSKKRPQRWRRPPPPQTNKRQSHQTVAAVGLNTNNNGNLLSSLVEQVRGTLSSMFYGPRAVSTFPRIQYGPLDFGPPLNVGPPKNFKVKEDPFLYDYSYRKIDDDDYLYENDDYFYQDDFSYEENTPKKFQKEREFIGTPSPEKEEGRVVGKSPSSGKISIIQPPVSAVPRTTTTASREPSTTSSKPSITSSYRNDQFNHGIRKELKHQEIEIEDNLGNHKIGTKYQNHIDDDDFDDGEDYVEISLKEKHLQDLINFVNGGKSPKVKDNSKKTTINLGVRKVANYDYNDLFDDVIETTPATDIFEDNIEWGQKLWAEVANDFESNGDSPRQRQKIKVKKHKKTTVKPKRPIKKNDEDARLLSIWAAAEKVSENGPSLRFESEEEEERLENLSNNNPRHYQTNRLPSKSLEEKPKSNYQGFYKPSDVNQKFFSNNFRGFQMKKDVPERDFYGGFKPSSLDLDNDLSSSESIRSSNIYNHQFKNHNLKNHISPSTSYDDKMIIDLPPATPSSLPPVPASSLQKQQYPYHYQPMTSVRTKTLQELTLRNNLG